MSAASSTSVRPRQALRRGRNSLSVTAMITTLVLLLSSCAFSRDSGDSVQTQTSESADADAKTEEAPEAEIEPQPTAIVLDASGSMNAEDAPGQRFAAAQKAVLGLVETIPDGQETSLITYGTQTGSSDSEKAAGCQDVTTVIDSAPIDKEAFASAVDALEPSGYTPIALALKTAAAQLPDSGERAIVLLSDGIDTCSDEGEQLDPCAVARGLGVEGGLTIHTVGFRVDGQTSKQLDCLSHMTGGTSWDAVNDKQLAIRLAMAINAELANSLLSPSGYRGLKPGMTIDEVKTTGGITEEIAGQGRVEIIYVDCTLTFVDGVLEKISTDTLATLDQIRPGDDIADAEAIYGDPERPTEISDDGAAIYSADPVEGTGFKFYFAGADGHQAGQELSGVITKMVLCKCTTTDSYSVANPPVGLFPGCEFQIDCTIYDAVQVQHPKQGALTLVLLDAGPDAEPGFGFGRLYLVDSSGKVMETDGTVAGVGTEPSDGGFDTSGHDGAALREIFHFMDPVTDRSGGVFFEVPGPDGRLPVNLAIDPDGYFVDSGDLVDYNALTSPEADDILAFGERKWGDIDVNGYYELTLMGQGSSITLRREGDRYVPQ